MNRTRIIHRFAGAMILVSVLLTYFVNPAWVFLAAFVGLNLLQASFTRWCLLDDILRKMGIPGECDDRTAAGKS
ncbi:MAG: DUF2892 domain-containing protein [Saprospiraceae bacterium]|jgi:hypothetical protein|nr:DUF2892 domain-containing protein [Saprospiraceae bacterium]MBP9210704.1 DUF2892 domain-containing protein [Saprospiraceae bacterium]MBV6474336.1 hypothetical protein [Saprospiraceae bacterium]